MRQNRTLEKPRLLGLAWPFIVVALLQAMFAVGSFYSLRAVRDSVGAERLWSKGQKDALHYLAQYADSGAVEDFRRYQRAIAAPLGEREMLLALDLPGADSDPARQSMLQGGKHAGAADVTLWLYRNFRDLGYSERTIELWRLGDNQLMALIGLAERMRAGIGTDQASAGQVRQWKAEIQAVGEKTRALAKALNDALGDDSRVLLRRLLVANLAFAGMLAFLHGRWQLTKRRARSRAPLMPSASGQGLPT